MKFFFVWGKDSNEDARAVGYEMPKIHSLWRALEMGFTEEWFDGFAKAFVGTDGRKSVCYDSAPVPVRAKAANRRRALAEIDPDQTEMGMKPTET